ncbi:hypothetical protein FACS1894186_6240 [Alphaproteobacteria bacterium]|nr:hypothetical protein FACS1894186_6240 [Alphaproteobacteria bacterium]
MAKKGKDKSVQYLSIRKKMQRHGMSPAWLCRPYLPRAASRASPKVLIVSRFMAGWEELSSAAYIDRVRWRKVRSTFWSFAESVAGALMGTDDPLPVTGWTNVLKLAGARGCPAALRDMQAEAAEHHLAEDFRRFAPDVIVMPTGDFMGGLVGRAIKAAFGTSASPEWEEVSPGTWHLAVARSGSKPKQCHIFITRTPQGWRKAYADAARATIVGMLRESGR